MLGDLLQRVVDVLEQPAQRAPVVRTVHDEPREPIDPFIRGAVLQRDHWRCVICGSRDRLEMDHIIPWSAGGADTIDNLRTLCHTCNTRRSNYVAPIDHALTLPTASQCQRCEPEECRYRDTIEVYCITCHQRSEGIADG